METPSTEPALYNPQINFGSPDSQHNIAFKQPMSATLQERLRKTRRSFGAGFSVAKRLKIDCDERGSSANNSTDNLPARHEDSGESAVGTTQSRTPLNVRHTCKSEVRTSLEVSPPSTSKDGNHQEMLQEKRRLLKHIDEKEDILRRLKMVKLYRSKNNLTEVQSLIEKWRKGSQLLLYELQSALSTENGKLSLTQLIESFGLDDKLLHYNRTEEDFEDQ
ncbi:swi5-dependent recombination DNA repair protein 1 homolog [Ascaphus truei]|uniref:swi5-dependent recombination DNA repair protein 1 homolog n=1 Tax=Ascaphus truei TaxID=8439 RepID=UPI003F59EFFB